MAVRTCINSKLATATRASHRLHALADQICLPLPQDRQGGGWHQQLPQRDGALEHTEAPQHCQVVAHIATSSSLQIVLDHVEHAAKQLLCRFIGFSDAEPAELKITLEFMAGGTTVTSHPERRLQ